jgi:hypothetical protein
VRSKTCQHDMRLILRERCKSGQFLLIILWEEQLHCIRIVFGAHISRLQQRRIIDCASAANLSARQTAHGVAARVSSKHAGTFLRSVHVVEISKEPVPSRRLPRSSIPPQWQQGAFMPGLRPMKNSSAYYTYDHFSA